MPTYAIVASDLHVDDYKAYGFNRDRLEDCLLVIDDVYKMAEKKEAKIILLPGDLFNTTKFLSTKAVNRLMARLSYWIDLCPDIVIFAITGNHDFATKNLPDKPAVSALEHLATAFPNNFTILDNQVMGGKVHSMTPYAVQGIPNYEFPEHYRQQLQLAYNEAVRMKKIDSDLKVTLMIHQSPKGQTNQMVTTNTDPDDPLYEPFDMVICGDIHTSQRINKKFLIAGNPLHRDLGDEGKDKGIWLIDLEDPTGIKFVTRKGRYPEFRTVKKGDAVVDSADNFIIQAPNVDIALEGKGVADIAMFSSTLPHDKLMENFWKEETGGKDKELLQIGLGFLK